MSPHRTPRRPTHFTSLIALTAILVAAALGLAACGGSTSTTTTAQTAANAAATGTTTTGTTTGTSTSGSTSTGTSSTGTTSTGTTSTGTTAGPSAATRYAATRTCLSKKGITVPQQAGAGGFLGGGAQLPKGMSRAQFAEALQSCGAGFNGNHFGKRGKGFHNPFNNPRFHAALTRFAACLRQNGIDIGEPNTSGKGPIFDTKGINTGSSQFKAAEATCRSTLLYALRPNQAHPGATSGSTTSG
jgi:hypothetical protein